MRAKLRSSLDGAAVAVNPGKAHPSLHAGRARPDRTGVLVAKAIRTHGDDPRSNHPHPPRARAGSRGAGDARPHAPPPEEHARASPRTSLGSCHCGVRELGFFGLSGLADLPLAEGLLRLTHSCAATDLTIARRELYVADLFRLSWRWDRSRPLRIRRHSRPSAGSVTTTVGVSPAPGGALASAARDVLTRGRLFECLATPRRSCAEARVSLLHGGRSWWFPVPMQGHRSR